MENFCGYYCLNIFVIIIYFSALNITVNITPKILPQSSLKQKPKIDGRGNEFFLEKLLGREILSSIHSIFFFLKSL